MPPERVGEVMERMIDKWRPLVAEIERCTDDCDATPGMRFAAGYGRAVLGAAMAYVAAHKDELVRAVGEAQTPEQPHAAAE